MLELANKYVAHHESSDKFDRIDLGLIIDNESNEAIDFRLNQTFYEPLSCEHFLEILKLFEVISKDIFTKIKELQSKIIQEYNQNKK